MKQKEITSKLQSLKKGPLRLEQFYRKPNALNENGVVHRSLNKRFALSEAGCCQPLHCVYFLSIYM